MPLNFQFIRAETGQPVPLIEIDEKICADVGRPCSDARYCPEFTLISNVGDAVYASGKWNESKFDELMKMPGLNDGFAALCRKYLNGEYRYDCWHQRSL
jgi:hypothetical protein